MAPKVEAYAEENPQCEISINSGVTDKDLSVSQNDVVVTTGETSAMITFKGASHGLAEFVSLHCEIQYDDSTLITDYITDFTKDENNYYCDAIQLTDLSPGKKYVLKKIVIAYENGDVSASVSHEFTTNNHNFDGVTEYSSDSSGHWYACKNSNCKTDDAGSKKDFAAHTPDIDAPTATQPQKCSVCMYKMKDALGLAKPTGIEGTTSFSYDGDEKTVSVAGFDDQYMNIEGNRGTDVNTYTVTVTPKKGYTWEDKTADAVSFNWSIVAGNQAAPTGLSGVKPTTEDGNGKITGTNTTMEYSVKGTSDWTTCSVSETEVAPGTYEVRYIAKTYYNAGAIAEVVVPDFAHECGSLTYISAKDPTCTDPGNIAHYKCSCGKLYRDTDAKQLLTEDEVKIAARHKYDNDKDSICNNCGYERTIVNEDNHDDDESTSGDTGSSSADTSTKKAERQQPSVFESKLTKHESHLQTATGGSTVKIEGDESFNALSSSIISAFMKNGKVDLEFSYSYKGQPYTIVIPAGTQMESGIPWYGPMYLWGRFGNAALLKKEAPQLTEAERAAFYEAFDAELYASLYADVVAVYGTGKDSLFEHYVAFGMNEGRKMRNS